MGKSVLHRQGEGKREMYLLLILLISPALGRPSSAQSSVGNKLEAVSEYPKGMSQLLKNSRLFGTVAEDLQEAKQNIREMEEELKSLESEIWELRNKDNYFQKFEEALDYIRLARKDLFKLAQTTQIEANKLINLLEFLDLVKDPAILTKFIASMESLMLETKKKLEDARGKYNRAHQAFENLIVSVATQNALVDRTVKQKNAQYQEDKAFAEAVRYSNCNFDYGIGQVISELGVWNPLCGLQESGIASISEIREIWLERDRVKLVNLKSKLESILEKTRILNQDIGDAIEVIKVEVELISKWAVSAEVVSQNIDEYPEEKLKKFKSMRRIFKNGLNALRIDAENFIDQILSV